MADERLRSKSELKRFVATNLKRKGWTDDMVAILIDVLWRDKFTMRTSGFYYPGGTDAIIAFDDVTRTFSILPVDPLVTDFIPRYGFYSWSNKAVYHRKYETETIQLPNEEGLFAIYFAADGINRTQNLHYIKNPTQTETKDLYLKKVLISFIYWDYDNQTALHFGDDRHGSEWNPQMHWMLHRTIKGQVDSGLTVTDMLINEDGSLDSHAQFTVQAGTMWHDDFILDIPSAGGIGTIPVLYFLGLGLHYPRFTETAGFGCYKVTTRIGYNATAESIVEATTGYHVMYHIFAVNEHVTAVRKVITVMGQNEYETLPEAYTNLNPELDTIYAYMPQQGTCYLGTVVFQTSDAYTNTVAARIVAFFEKDKIHPPVAIALDSIDFLKITESQVLSWKGDRPITVTQPAHAFTVGNAIRHNETIFVKAQADNDVNAQTCGIVTKVIDADNFQYKSEGFLVDAAFVAGKEYFLSPTTAGLVMEQPIPEVWTVGEVRQSLGWGTPQGLKIEIDVGDEIGEATVTANEVTSLVIAGGNLTLTQSAGANVVVPFPYYTKTELNTSGAGGAVHWNNVTNKPTIPAAQVNSDWNAVSGFAEILNKPSLDFDNYAWWKFRSYDPVYGNKEFNMISGYQLAVSNTAAIDIEVTSSNYQPNLKIHHKDTSTQASSVNSGSTFIQSIELDDFGHVTTIGTSTANYYTKTELNTSAAGGAVHWDNVTNKPTFSNYSYWTVKIIDYAGTTLINSNINSATVFEFRAGEGIDFWNYSQYSLRIKHGNTSAQADVSNSGTTVVQSLTFDVFGHVTGVISADVGGSGVTDHGALTGLADDDHPQYALVNGAYGNYFQVAELRIASATGWSLVDNGSVLELQYNGVKKFEFKTTGEAFGTDFIVY